MLRDIVYDAQSKEQDLQKYLENHMNILILEFGSPNWYFNKIVPQFRFGSEYVSDFVLVSGQSYNYWIKLIELEPANTPIFNHDRTYSKRLNQAIRQVGDWNRWISNNDGLFRRNLEFAIKKRDPRFEESLQKNSTIKFNVSKHIVIGNRKIIGESSEEKIKDRELRATLFSDSNIDVVTYDRLIAAEEKIIRNGVSPIITDDWNYSE